MPAGVSAYVPLANLTIGVATTSVTFSSISTSYRDLVLIINCSTTTAGVINLTLNGDTALGSYKKLGIAGTGTTAETSGGSNLNLGNSASGDRLMQINFFDYAITNKHKPILVKHAAPSSVAESRFIRWTNTAAISTILLTTTGTTFTAGSTFALYGVSA